MNSNLKDYEQLIETISSIPNQHVLTPNLPVDIFLQEAENLFHWVQQDKEKLLSVGIPEELIDDLPRRAGALREAQARWIKELNTRRKFQTIWNERSPEAFDFRDTLIHTCRYAYRHHPDILGRIAYIAEDYSNADMIQDLQNLAVLGKNNPEPLKAIGFDMEELDRASRMSDEMADLLARANGENSSDHEDKVIRDKAFTYLKEAVDEIRECGKYLFWRNEERLKGYSSAYMRRIRNRMKASKDSEAEGMAEDVT